MSLLLLTMIACGPVSNVEPTGPKGASVRVLPSGDLHALAAVLVMAMFIVPAVIACWACTPSVKVALAPAPMSAKAATPKAPTVRTLREYAMRLFLRREIVPGGRKCLRQSERS